MYAGTVARLDTPADEPLEPLLYADGHPPAMVIDRTQATLDDRPVQTGQAAGSVEVSTTTVDVGRDDEDTVWIDVNHDKVNERIATDWVAEVTGSGLVISESVGADDELEPFPFDIVSSQAGADCRRLSFDIRQLSRAWLEDDVLSSVWMVAAADDDGEGVSIDYGAQARLENVSQATIGLGFKRSFQGSGTRGVIFESGYTAAYRDWPASKFVRFVEHELLPFAYEYEPENAADQVDFDSFGGGS